MLPSNNDGLTSRIRQDIVSALNWGVGLTAACNHANVTRDQVFRWLARAPEGGMFAELQREIRMAEARNEMELIGTIKSIALGNKKDGRDPNWRAAAWLAERRHGETWNIKRHEESAPPVDNEKKYTIDDINKMPLKDRMKLVAMLKSARKALKGDQVHMDDTGKPTGREFHQVIPPPNLLPAPEL